MSLLLSFGHNGLTLTPPEGVQVAVPRPVEVAATPESAPPAAPLATSPAAAPPAPLAAPPSEAPVAPPAAPVAPPPPRAEDLVRAALEHPLAGPPLRELAAGKRRAVVLVGDLAHPAPYPRVLAELTRALVASGIRPTRITFCAVPGTCGPILGRFAIRRYGEEIVGEHELNNWQAATSHTLPPSPAAPAQSGARPPSPSPGEGTASPTESEAPRNGSDEPQEDGSRTVAGDANGLDPAYAAADLRLAVLPAAPDFGALLPAETLPDFVVAVAPGRAVFPRVAQVVAGPADAVRAKVATSAVPAAEDTPPDVLLLTGGGAPADETLEEALAALPRLAAAGAAPTLVLAFSGTEGLGSAHFTLDLWNMLRQADEYFTEAAARGTPAPKGEEDPLPLREKVARDSEPGEGAAGPLPLREKVARDSEPGEGSAAPEPAAPAPAWGAAFEAPWDPAQALADALLDCERVILFSPALSEHDEGDDLRERLEQHPGVAQRLHFVATEAALWELLAKAHGPRYRLLAEPLGWRAAVLKG